jgi:hypothetical protein
MVVGDVGNMFGWGGVCGSVARASGVVWAAQKMPSWYVGVQGLPVRGAVAF